MAARCEHDGRSALEAELALLISVSQTPRAKGVGAVDTAQTPDKFMGLRVFISVHRLTAADIWVSCR